MGLRIIFLDDKHRQKQFYEVIEPRCKGNVGREKVAFSSIQLVRHVCSGEMNVIPSNLVQIDY